MLLHPVAKAIKKVMTTKMIGVKNATKKMASVTQKEMMRRKEVMKVAMKVVTTMRRGEGLRKLRINSSCDQSTHL